MIPSTNIAGPRAWMSSYFAKNPAFFASKARGDRPVDFSHPRVAPGGVCLGVIHDAVVCCAAGHDDLARGILLVGERLIHEALDRFGARLERDFIDLDRPQMALARGLGSILAPDLFGALWPVPFDAFPRFIEADGRLLEEANAGRVLWALYAVFEGAEDQYQASRALKLRSHRDLRQEMAFVPALPDLFQGPDHSRWAEYEPILARWLNPILQTKSYASNFQDMMAGLLVLIWAKRRLGRLDRETVLASYFGETLSVSVVVE